ncbi:thiamine-monophosphate kinase [Chitinivorax tropicus]|uniref:Thiamine-monophosphate kinase n=1 Tax=Chitinivorax tropicus TaxID=714531 RepID=A0A840MLR7_9PROT|nr:thiamine-phosphate kinase [Chitinivorax tropicus]MBB5017652.1 thiamine-monophosphate kinase [Chitinivorax tropicus]
MDEFKLIQRFFTRSTPDVMLGIGDDAALVQPTPGMALAMSADMLVAGRHFLPDTDPFRLGWKTLAVNLSDMAAMAAQPRWALLSVALPAADAGWLDAFSQGFFTLADQWQVRLVGGDTTRGPLNLSVQIMGEVLPEQALRRDAAQVGDDIWVSGYLGEAALGLAHLQGRLALPDPTLALQHLEQPVPRVALGLALRGLAHSAIDVSDGLLADLGHILARSGVGAEVDSRVLARRPELAAELGKEFGLMAMLSGGDDYELCFTAPRCHREQIGALSDALQLPLSRIGQIVPTGLVVLDLHGRPMSISRTGFNHFAE